MQTLSKDQANALTAIGKWLKHYQNSPRPGSSDQYFTLGGYAGTGKTTLLVALRHVLYKNYGDMRVAYAAYTGKAALVLKQKMKHSKPMSRGDSISTLHSLLYYTQSSGEGSSSWQLKKSLDYDLIIVDEASMVSQDIWQDLLSFGKPILAVGDHGQLPPIGSKFNLMLEPFMRLEQIWRQAADSPIIKLATMARQTGAIAIGDYSSSSWPNVHKLSQAEPETGDAVEQILQAHNNESLILVGYNNTRQKLNSHIRVLKGFETPEPARGDTIVCLRNNREAGLYNGQIGTLEALVEADNDPEGLWYYGVANFDGTVFEGYMPREQFSVQSTLTHPPRRTKSELVGLFDFGYCLTVHKAQGSQAKRVLVFEERFAQMEDSEWKRWLYTAVTRAEEELVIIGS